MMDEHAKLVWNLVVLNKTNLSFKFLCQFEILNQQQKRYFSIAFQL